MYSLLHATSWCLNSTVKLWLVAKVLLEMKQVVISEGCSEDGERAWLSGVLHSSMWVSLPLGELCYCGMGRRWYIKEVESNKRSSGHWGWALKGPLPFIFFPPFLSTK